MQCTQMFPSLCKHFDFSMLGVPGVITLVIGRSPHLLATTYRIFAVKDVITGHFPGKSLSTPPYTNGAWLLSQTATSPTVIAYHRCGHSCLPSQLLEQRLGLLEVGGVKALGEPAVDRRQQRMGFVPACPAAARGELRLMAARSSSDFASWRRATSRARCNQASASACGVPVCRRSKTPRRRWISASQ